ncbi:MAG: RNA methyltransferase [Bacteroidota bacterium]
MTPERSQRLKTVAYRRQFNMTVILENVHDKHNIGAVMRSCDAVGIREIFVLYTEPDLQEENLVLGKRTSAGTRKWVNVHYYRDAEACFGHVRRHYQQIWSTHLGSDSVMLHDMDLSASIALLFGNEKDGVSQTALAYTDGNFVIPQMGMVRSLNISVACAVSLYEAYRQRQLKGMYEDNPTASLEQKEQLYQQYVDIHEAKRNGRTANKPEKS